MMTAKISQIMRISTFFLVCVLWSSASEAGSIIIYQADFTNGLPPGWSIIDGYSDGQTWTSSNPGNRSSHNWTGTFMIVDSDSAGEVDMDEELITHSIDCSAYRNVMLKFKHYYKWRYAICDIAVRANGGSWQRLARYQMVDTSGLVELDLSPIADGQPDVQIRWHYWNAYEDHYWGIDDVEICASSPDPGGASNPNPPDGATLEQRWVKLSWSPGTYAVSHDVYFGENFEDVNNGTPDAFQCNQTDTWFSVGSARSPYLVPGTTYYWRIDELGADGTIHTGTVWSFTIPVTASYPIPYDRDRFVNPNVTLSWTVGFGAKLHHIYIGDNFADVNDGTGDTYKGWQSFSTYATGNLELGKTYYWRIDEFDGSDTHKGDVWSFTTAGGPVAPEYYIATDGDDSNPGTLAQPFKKISRACDAIRYGPLPAGGVTVWIRGGTYRETVRPTRSGTAETPIRFVAYPGELPIVSGADILDVSWAVHSGEIYKATTNKEFIQLFVDGQMMNEARWPNTAVDDLVHMRRASCDSGTNANNLVDYSLPPGDWNGAYVHITPGSEWNSSTKQIRNYQPSNRLDFSDNAWVRSELIPEGGNPYWLFGALVGLDTATEWFLDLSADTVYIWCPGDPDPAAHTIEVKQRDQAFDLAGLAHIHIEGLWVFAAGINMNGAAYCVVDDCHVKYPEHTRFVWSWSGGAVNANYLGGRHNEWKNSSIAYSATNGIYDTGDYNRVTNCIIHDVDYMAGNHAAITTRGYVGEYTWNTLYNSGRHCINHKNASGFRIEYNDMFNPGLLTESARGVNTGDKNGGGTVIAYNHIHDNSKRPAYGIFLGDGSSHYTVHHNLIWNINRTGIYLGKHLSNTEIYNNTILSSCNKAFGTYIPAGEAADQRGTTVINNLAKAPMSFVTGTNGPDHHHNGSYSVDNDGWPTSYSGAIDAGVIIPGITDGYVGSAPDIGCYEVGTEGWEAGADWVEEEW